MGRAKLSITLLVLLGLVLSILYLKRDMLVMKIFSNVAEKTMTRNVITKLDPQGIHVGFCGTGSPIPNRDRVEACTAIYAAGRLFIFDMGEGGSKNFAQMGFPYDKVEGVWLTHLHSDHFEGLGSFSLQRWGLSNALSPLAVYGPKGVEQITQGLNQAYKIDSGYRMAHHGTAILPPSGYGMLGTSIEPGLVYDKNGVRITAFAVNHAPVAPAFGYRIDFGGHSVTISGDTAPTEQLTVAAKGSDLLVSEILSPRMVKILEQTASRAHLSTQAKILHDIPGYHMPPEAAADIARASGVKMLAFTHVVPSVPKWMESALIGDAHKHYAGTIAVMHDGDIISILGNGKIEKRNLFSF